MKKLFSLACIVMASVFAIAGCGSSSSATYKDGTYTAQSSVFEGMEDEDGEEGGEGYGEVTITIKDNVITACEFTTYMPDGTKKDDDYGKKNGEIANQDYYNKAQRAVKASANYAEQLAAKGSLDEVDAITGASISYQEFQEAVELALKQAKE